MNADIEKKIIEVHNLLLEHDVAQRQVRTAKELYFAADAAEKAIGRALEIKTEELVAVIREKESVFE